MITAGLAHELTSSESPKESITYESSYPSERSKETSLAVSVLTSILAISCLVTNLSGVNVSSLVPETIPYIYACDTATESVSVKGETDGTIISSPVSFS